MDKVAENTSKIKKIKIISAIIIIAHAIIILFGVFNVALGLRPFNPYVASLYIYMALFTVVFNLYIGNIAGKYKK